MKKKLFVKLINNIRKLIKSIIYVKFPILGRLYGAIFNKKSFHTFSGWGLTTTGTFPPWINTIQDKKNVHNVFIKIDQHLRRKIKDKKFNTTEFKNFTSIQLFERLDFLKWRFYIVYITALHAALYTKSKNKNFVECGVGDGFTAFYAVNTLKEKKIKFTCHLYDAWEGMKKKYTHKKEKGSGTYANKFEFLNYEITKNNFKDFKNIRFVKGDLPESLKISSPNKVSWLSIDLNSSIPTTAVLKHFYDKIETNGIILLDDYGHAGYVKTKEAVDIFLEKKKSIVFQIPTGQAIIIKK